MKAELFSRTEYLHHVMKKYGVLKGPDHGVNEYDRSDGKTPFSTLTHEVLEI